MNITAFPQVTFAYFDKSLADVKNFLEIYKNERQNDLTKWSVIESVGKPSEIFAEFERLKQQRKSERRHDSQQAFFYNPLCDTDKTVMFSNLFDGWYTLCNIASRRLACECYLFHICENGVSEFKNCLTYFDGCGVARVVYVLKEGQKWLFFEHGNPLWFENVSFYEEKLKRQRLSKEILLGYCQKLGLDLGNFEFWESAGNGLFLEVLFS